MLPGNGLLLILLSTVTIAAYFILITRLMRALPAMSSNFFLCLSNYSAALLLLPVWLWLRLHGHIITPSLHTDCYLLLTAALLLLSRELYYYAYARTDVANITVFSALTPVYTLLTGLVILHEMPSARVTGGIILVTLAIYAIFMPQRGEGRRWLETALQPFRKISGSRPVLYGFLSTLPTALAAVYQKQTLFGTDAVTFSLCLFLLIGMATLAIELCKSTRETMRDNLIIVTRPSFWAAGLLLAVTHVTFAPILVTHHSATALALQRCSILFQIIFAYVFLHQKEQSVRRILASLAIILAFVIMWTQS